MDTIIERVLFLQGIELFSEIPTEQLAYLAGITEQYTVPKDQVLFTEGEPSQTLYVLVRGEIKLSRSGKPRKQITEPEAIGPWGFFDGNERLMSATCVQDSHFLTINRMEFFDLLEDRVHLSRGLLTYFVKRIRKLTELSDAIV
ncbi:MAG: Crp/Fnr family transcriptional regulator [Cyclonatronaceae bacterium]